jgi:phage anti-repressor protein
MSITQYQEAAELKDVACPYIRKAFEHNYNNITGMTIKEFIKVTEYPIDNFMADNFFHNLNDNIPIYVTNELIEWCGFSSKSFDHRKRDFNIILENFVKGEDYWTYSNKEYEEYYGNSISRILDIENSPKYPKPSEFKGKNKTKHLILSVLCFKQILMMITTSKAKEIRLYYISLETLIKIYSKYQWYQQRYRNMILEASNRELKADVAKLLKNSDEQCRRLAEMKESDEVLHEVVNEMHAKLNKSTDERAPRTRDIKKHEAFIITRISDAPAKYYAVRCQTTTINRTLQKLRLRHPLMRVLLTIEYQPNSKNLYNLVKENIDRITFKRNNIELDEGYTEAQFIRDIQALDYAKKELSSDDEFRSDDE